MVVPAAMSTSSQHRTPLAAVSSPAEAGGEVLALRTAREHRLRPWVVRTPRTHAGVRLGDVPRVRLVTHLRDAHDRPLVILSAPAGYGKTTVLAQWAAADARPFAWVETAHAHRDPVALVGALTVALDPIEPVPRMARRRLVEPPAERQPPGLELAERLTWLGMVLATRSRPFVIVIDDLQDVESQVTLEMIGVLLEHLPHGSQVAVASRTEPDLPVARLMAEGAVLRLDARDLALDEAEGAALTRGCGAELGATEAVRRYEGWATGLRLTALSVARHGREEALAEPGVVPEVTRYLAEEVLDPLPGATLEFLTRTSVLDRLSGSLCDALLDRTGSGLVLRDLERANAFLVPLDRTGEWFRYHGLFAEVLRAELRRREAERIPELHRRARAWFEAHGELDAAIEHARAAGDVREAGRLIWSRSLDHLSRGMAGTLRGWLAAFDDEQIASCPELALTAAWCCVEGRTELAAHWTAAASSAADEGPLLGVPPGIAAALATLRATLAADGAGRMLDDADLAANLEPAEGGWHAYACFLQGVARYLHGDPEGARARLVEGMRRAGDQVPAVRALCLARLALLAGDVGAWDRATALGRQARAIVESYGLRESPLMAMAYAVSALVLAHAGRPRESAAEAQDAARLVAAAGGIGPWLVVEARILLARAALQRGDLEEARAFVVDVQRLDTGLDDAPTLKASVEEAHRASRLASESGPRLRAGLTPAEIRVLSFLPTHLSFPEIAGRLHLAPCTVKSQALSAYRKLRVSSRSEAVDLARRAGLLDA